MTALLLAWVAAAAAASGLRESPGVGFGGGVALVRGGNADGYAPGLAERLLVDVPTGPLVGFSIEADHSRHALRDAGAYYPEASVPADALTGFRDAYAVDAGFRLGVDVGPDGPVGVQLFVRPSMGVVVCGTLLDAPGVEGRVALRSWAVAPAPGLAVGIDVRPARWIHVLPQVKGQAQIAQDQAEATGAPARVGVEGRLLPALDLRFPL